MPASRPEQAGSGTHQQRVRAAFTGQAGTFEDARLNLAFTSGLDWLLSHLDPRPDDVVLDVAAGTGIVSRGLAPHVALVVAADSTPAMVARGRREAAAEGHDNLRFVSAAAERLPVRDGACTLVVTRFSLHHFAEPAPPLDEMVRALAPGGRLVVQDLVASADQEVAARQDHVERLRDPSHVRMPAPGAVRGWLRDRGLDVRAVAEREIDRPVEPWLEQSLTDAQAASRVRDALAEDLAGGETTGMRPHRGGSGVGGGVGGGVDGEVWFRQRWEVTVAHKP